MDSPLPLGFLISFDDNPTPREESHFFVVFIFFLQIDIGYVTLWRNGTLPPNMLWLSDKPSMCHNVIIHCVNSICLIPV